MVELALTIIVLGLLAVIGIRRATAHSRRSPVTHYHHPYYARVPAPPCQSYWSDDPSCIRLVRDATRRINHLTRQPFSDL